MAIAFVILVESVVLVSVVLVVECILNLTNVTFGVSARESKQKYKNL